MTTMKLPPAKHAAKPKVAPPGGPKQQAGATWRTKPMKYSPPPAKATGNGQVHSDTHQRTAVPGPLLRSPFLRLAADVVDDMEHVRNANQNRLRQLTRTGPDQDGKHRGFELDPRHPDVQRLAELVTTLEVGYEMSVKNLEKLMKEHPLWEWAKPISGVGQKQFARLLAAIGDPYWHEGFDRPRGLYELYAYCGLDPVDGVGRRRRRGELSTWNDVAKMRVYLIAESCVQQVPLPEREVIIKGVARRYKATAGSPYRAVYEHAREHYADAVHDVAPCPQCGTPGKPAPVGSELRDGHKHQRALRRAAKKFLEDLWVEAKRLHKEAQ